MTTRLRNVTLPTLSGCSINRNRCLASPTLDMARLASEKNKQKIKIIKNYNSTQRKEEKLCKVKNIILK